MQTAPDITRSEDAAAPRGGRRFVRIGGMHCQHCEETLRRALGAVEGVEEVRFRGHVAEVSPGVDPALLVAAVREAGYETRPEWVSDAPPRWGAWRAAALAAALAAAWWALRRALGFDPLDVFPTADGAASLGALFVVGLFTSLHCAGMCGAFALHATAGRTARPWRAALLYNAGRIGVYAAIGAAAGALGEVLSPGPRTRGVLQLAAGLAMVIFALRQLGLLRLPRAHGFATGFATRGAGRFAARTPALRPLLVGAANGFMPCGPLQAVQLWALGSGSAARGALALACFGLGTAPLMFALGAGAAFFARQRALVATLAGALVLVLGLGMARRGAVALRVAAPARAPAAADSAGGAWLRAADEGGVQVVRFALEWDGYPDFAVEAGRPVRLVVHAEPDKITGCNNEFSCPALGFHLKLAPGDNVAEFTPAAPGIYTYSCWMDMLFARILVEPAHASRN